jgi:hypothetical protein
MVGEYEAVMTAQEWDWFIKSCIERGWNVSSITHPKSRANVAVSGKMYKVRGKRID